MDDRFTAMRSDMDERFDRVDERFCDVERRLGQVDVRIFEQEKHFVALSGELVAMRHWVENLTDVLRAELHRELRLHLLAMFSLCATIAGVVAAVIA